MSVVRQLLVRHRALDPTAWSALHALESILRPCRPVALTRAALWEFTWEGEADLSRSLVRWGEGVNWFWNPSRDRATWRASDEEPTELESGPLRQTKSLLDSPALFLITTWRGEAGMPQHEDAARRALGVPVQVRSGQVWWLAFENGRASEVIQTIGFQAGGGLLINPHSQEARFGVTLPLPALATLGDVATVSETTQGGRA